ncbi:MAG TPA: iron-sulfur cluster assembly accessory protein [Cyanobacteria bacterium UBA11149]|nr:iron-sulfur cluster assembly accessory protein [Cyanobacteria bacterium UBA11367]HBE58653.1 iron-sulfur cluster assembly accessory protein [Cyanobacteria bacterium UBA11366]HBK66704.1 iron-sulfur cluster assembly accessory protein [Cyanobacteria bacterium UBA11166]HBR73961.1 iron-sulfur cluster assembly accessory protein [Cyanobacteria bacterium UBA11159]HBS69607.1 iron-sulfur cluster assembly accessory protein [Cyanobacteria bacterium UBA11153]HBW88496.1 iron-sulfur cluster assembly access
MTLTLTEVAELRLRAFLQGSAKGENQVQRGVRFSVVDGGCSGYQYSLDITNEPNPDDLCEQQGKIRVYIDKESAPLLEGVVVDYVDGLTQSGFKFLNPNATDTCGCGQSFQAGNCTPTGVPCS